MIKYSDEGIITNDSTVASMFLGKEVTCKNTYGEMVTDEWCVYWDGIMFDNSMDGFLQSADEIRIPYPLIAEAIKPVEGEGYVLDTNCHLGIAPLVVYSDWGLFNACKYHKRVLFIITTRAELRELVERTTKGEVT